MASATTDRPEALRERDVNRYYQPYKNALSQNQKALLVDTFPDDPEKWTSLLNAHNPAHSRDAALTAFAQLATLRLDVGRCLISLLDSKYQYVLTEATKTLSLSRHTIDKGGDRLWLGNTIFNRNDAMCHYVFGKTYTATDPDGSTYTGEGLVVCDTTKVDEYKNKVFVTGEPHVIFFAAVPIRSQSGHVIGTYACSSHVPRPEGLSIAEFRFMQDMSSVVMEHLEMVRDREDRNKGERMVKGLSDFIEGSCALGKLSYLKNMANGSNKIKAAQCDAPEVIVKGPEGTEAKGAANGIKTADISITSVLQRQSENLKKMALEDVDSPLGHDVLDLASLERKTSQTTGRRIVQPPPTNPTCIFYRAADIIRRSTLADGAVFFRSSGPNLKTKSPVNAVEESSMDESQSQTSGSENPGAGLLRDTTNSRSQRLATQKKQSKMVDPHDSKNCEVLGLSVEEDLLDNGKLDLEDFKFLETSMEKYIRKFPHGKFFSFTESGSGLSSGETESEVEPALTAPATNGYKSGTGAKSRRQKFIPTELLKILPGVRTLIFLPLWDSAIERWIAGGFIWTSHAGALLSPTNELPYLKAFGNSITSEFARMNALISDRAKSDFISSISHELRSPLHGILGSAEFLSDTDLTEYQKGMVASVETCAKVLLDTLEHVLDFAKINNNLSSRDRTTRRLEAKFKKTENESSVMGPTAEVDLHQLIEEVSESVCAGHAFRETHAGAGFISENPKQEGASNLSHLAVSVEIAPRLKCLVNTQPGAIRRIIMNLLGNSLKYTKEGYVAVKMRGQAVPGDPSSVEVFMTFEDSGKGMSIEYQRTRMFSPFSQEDPFVDGTGLGLSIVRQIVDSLGGHIDVKSTKGVGTTVEVHLILMAAGEQPDQFEDVHALAAGKRLLLVGGNNYSKNLDACTEAFNVNIAEWFGLEMGELSEDFANHCADGLICHESSPRFCQLAVGSTPLMVVCNNQSNQVALRRRLMTTLPPCSRANVHIIAQPLGPHKLAQAFRHMFADRCKSGPLTPGETQPATAVGISVRDTKSSVDVTQPLYPPAPPIKTYLSETMQAKGADLGPLVRAQTEPFELKEDVPQSVVPVSLKHGLSQEQSLPGHNVLLVDDNAINLQLLVMFMKKIKVRHARARDGLEALDTYQAYSRKSDRFSYVLMDLSMPRMDGLESTRRIRQFERERVAPKAIIIALTGLGSQEAQQAALDAGVDYYLAKPVKFADLKRLMNM